MATMKPEKPRLPGNKEINNRILKQTILDAVLFLILTLILYLLVRPIDMFEKIYSITRKYEKWELDELASLTLISFFTLLLYLLRRLYNLKIANRQIRYLSETDVLTGILNRRRITELITTELHRRQRYHGKASVIMTDLDCFKEINDTWGHKAGDFVLRQVTGQIGGYLRKTDLFGRLGGDEFVILLPGTDAAQARHLAQRFCTGVASFRLPWNDSFLSITLSIGITEIRPEDESAEEILNRADKHLYRAKELGRNRIVSPGSSDAPEPPLP